MMKNKWFNQKGSSGRSIRRQIEEAIEEVIKDGTPDMP
jgi:hypothetical protein